MKKNIEWLDYDYSKISELQTETDDGKIMKINSTINELEDPAFIINDQGEHQFVSTLTFGDENGDKIQSLPISKKRFISMKQRSLSGERTEVIAKITKEEHPANKKTGQPKLINKMDIIKSRTGDTPLRKIQATKSEIAIVKKFLGKVMSNTNRFVLFNHIKETIIEEFGIVGVNNNPEYSDSLDTIILQAFSGGKIGNTPGKIHTVIIGSPATGKKLLFEAAKLINFISQEAQSGPLSTPGLVGTCKPINGVRQVDKGLIPMANGGVFGIQDFDKSQMKPELFGILGPVMEDGISIVTKAGKAKFKSETAIHIDLNRQSDLTLDRNTMVNIIDDIGLPTFFLSRSDYICELPTNTKRQFKVALESIQKGSGTNSGRCDEIYLFCKKNEISHHRFLKLITAYLMEKYTNIDSDNVRPIVEKKFKALIKTNKGNLAQLSNLAMFIMRFKNGIWKFIETATRIQLLKKSNKAAVDMAFHLLSRKLEFLQNIDPVLLVPKYRKSKADLTAEWVFNTFENKIFSIKDVVKKNKGEKYPLGNIQERQLRNRIKEVCTKKGHNKWTLNKSYIKAFTK